MDLGSFTVWIKPLSKTLFISHPFKGLTTKLAVGVFETECKGPQSPRKARSSDWGCALFGPASAISPAETVTLVNKC